MACPKCYCPMVLAQGMQGFYFHCTRCGYATADCNPAPTKKHTQSN